MDYNFSDEEFRKLVIEAIDELPDQTEHMKNIAIVVEDEPTPEQRAKLHLHQGQTLFGLYEGIPLTNRGNNYTFVLPDKITIFKQPLEASANSLESLKSEIKRTVWHEIAHHYGLDHDRMEDIRNGKP